MSLEHERNPQDTQPIPGECPSVFSVFNLLSSLSESSSRTYFSLICTEVSYFFSIHAHRKNNCSLLEKQIKEKTQGQC